ncbi:MAG: HemK/PrmC family methyltransferase [bacterium]|nr:HemK/PrmC family methyltransferase [bacterium]
MSQTLETQTLEKLLHMGTECLGTAGISDAALDAWYLLSDAFQIDRTHYLLKKRQELDESALQAGYKKYLDALNMRQQRVPLQHILKSQEFMALPFLVDEHVLIPRQDTETLVELVLKECQDKNMRVLDMCTGSGCIALSLAVWGGYRQVAAVDVSREALGVAIENVRQLYMNPEYRKKGGCETKEKQEICMREAPIQMCWKTGKPQTEFYLLESDLFSNVQDLTFLEKFDVLVSNPPYIPSDVIESLEPEVRDHEPRMALDGRADGLYFYRRLAAEAPAYLKPGARVYFEIGYDQGEALRHILSECGFEQIRILSDLAGNDRVAAAMWSVKEYLPDAREGLRRGGDGPH